MFWESEGREGRNAEVEEEEEGSVKRVEMSDKSASEMMSNNRGERE